MKTKKLALFGSGAVRTIKGGFGSGDPFNGGLSGGGSWDVDLNERYNIHIYNTFKKAGYDIVNSDMLDAYADAYDAQHKIEGNSTMNCFKFPEMEITNEELADASADSDTAIYVISRNAGEGTDRTLKGTKGTYNGESYDIGDYYLTDLERENLERVAASFKKTIVVLNVGGIMDTKFYNEINGLDAMLLMGQAGQEGGNALLDVLTGAVTPSGKLADTWAENYSDYPASDTFANADGNVKKEVYNEGIYVGYRYFDTFRKKALFPFGYGLSYTEFRLGTAGVEANGAQVTVRTTVENTGTMAGRQVVQVYLSKPAGKLDAPRQELCAFAKTRTLTPGKAETVTCSFSLPEMAAYDAETASYILEAGDHLVRVGVSSAETVPAAVLHLGKTVPTLQAKNVLGSTDFTDLTAPAAAMERPEGVPVIEIDPASIVCETIDYARTEEILPEVDALTKEDAALLLIGDFDPNAKGFASMIGTAGRHVCGAAGESCSTVKGIPWLIMADGPAGLRLAKEYYEDGKGKHAVGNALMPDSIMEMLSGPMKLVMSLMGGNGKPKAGCEIKTQYCTAIPIGTALAQSFDTDFVQRCGDIVGEEMEHFGVHLWLAPALNIHRSIRCGRNFEYYSEDPLVSGKMAAAMTRGVQAHKGCGTTIKHYAANNKEYNRTRNNSMVSERAMREIYLKGFGICVRESQPKAVMTSYNLLNGTHTAESRGLVTDILRAEFGYQGIVMTDWVTPTTGDARSAHRDSQAQYVAAAGGDLFMPGSKGDYDNLLQGIDSGAVTLEQVKINASRVVKMARALTQE